MYAIVDKQAGVVVAAGLPEKAARNFSGYVAWQEDYVTSCPKCGKVVLESITFSDTLLRKCTVCNFVREV